MDPVSLTLGILCIILIITFSLLFGIGCLLFVICCLILLLTSRSLLVHSVTPNVNLFSSMKLRSNLVFQSVKSSKNNLLNYMFSQLWSGDEQTNNILHQIERCKMVSGFACALVLYFCKESLQDDSKMLKGFVWENFGFLYLICAQLTGMILQLVESPVIFSLRLIQYGKSSEEIEMMKKIGINNEKVYEEL